MKLLKAALFNNLSILEMFVFVGLLQLELMTYDRIEAPEPHIVEMFV